ncbi:MAG TPA: cytidine deaminase [Ktedonobacterales bacterium]|nr:cytidine deaminase [Ktedonobacterales bacterium]
MRREQLLQRARAAAAAAYAPYSHFRVGAAVVIQHGERARVVTGANIENASYGLTLCAERSALAAALTSTPSGGAGADRGVITHLAVACVDAPPNAPVAMRTPCGACRQWLAELAPNAIYYIDGLPGAYHLDDLLPLAFRAPGEPEAH